jgi:pimeloyl-[acyl-carrier protein] methyl ester esterase
LKFTVLESALNQRILLITGWGGGTKLLQPLAHALQHKGHSVELINIFNGLDTQALQQHAEQAKDFDVIIGWSLGGNWRLYWSRLLNSSINSKKY